MNNEDRPTQRHGSPSFYSLLNEMADTHEKKSHDYATNDNPFGNYLFAGHVAVMYAHSPLDAGFSTRLAEKMYRLSVLEGGGKTPKNESIDDTERDIAVIATLWMAARKDARTDNAPPVVNEMPNQAEQGSLSTRMQGDMIHMAEYLSVKELYDMESYLRELRISRERSFSAQKR